MQKIELELPFFKGFYGSWLDDEIEQHIEYELNEMGVNYDDVNVKYDYTEYSKGIFDFVNSEYLAKLHFLQDCEFLELWSPKYYNYTNDKIYFNCNIDVDAFLRWFNDLMLNDGSDVSEMVKDSIIDEHTSCSGFVSFHSNKLSDWVLDINKMDLSDSKTVYKIGFVIGAYLENERIFLDDRADNFELEFLESDYRECIYGSVWIEK